MRKALSLTLLLLFLTVSYLVVSEDKIIEICVDGLENNPMGEDIFFRIVILNKGKETETLNVGEIEIMKGGNMISYKRIDKEIVGAGDRLSTIPDVEIYEYNTVEKEIREKSMVQVNFTIPKDYFQSGSFSIDIIVRGKIENNESTTEFEEKITRVVLFTDNNGINLDVFNQLQNSSESSEPTSWLGNWYAGDMHVHSEHSHDSNVAISQIAAKAWQIGMDFVTITDHSADIQPWWPWNEWQEVLNECNAECTSTFVCMRGEEIGTSDHFNLLGSLGCYGGPDPESCPGWNNLFSGIISNEPYYFGFVNHPYSRAFLYDGEWECWDTLNWGYPNLRGMEICNYGADRQDASTTFRAMYNSDTTVNSWVEFLLRRRRVLGVGCSDAHNLDNLGRVRTYLYLNSLSQNEILGALMHGRAFFSSANSQGVLPLLSIEAKTSSSNWKRIGDTLNAVGGEMVTIRIHYYSPLSCTVDLFQGSEAGETRMASWARPSGDTYFDYTITPTRDCYVRAELYRGNYNDSTLNRAWTNPIWIHVGSGFADIPFQFQSNSLHVVGDGAKCTDVLGTANVSWSLGYMHAARPEGKTDLILTSTEHSNGNLIIAGGPAVNLLAVEFGDKFGIAYYYNPNPPNPVFHIFAEGQTITLDIDNYNSKLEDICIVYLGRENNRNILLIWGFGWEGTYAGSVFMSIPEVWNAYPREHLLLLRWRDINDNDFVEFSEIHPENIPEVFVAPHPPGTPQLVNPVFGNIPALFAGAAFHVVGDGAKCTDVLGTANVSWSFGRAYISRPEGKTDLILTSTEHSNGNLIVVGGPAVNLLAVEFGDKFGIAYYYNPNPPNPVFQIFAEGQTITLDIDNYNSKLEDICIIYLGRENNRNILLIWGFGWEGTYAGSVFMSNSSNWTQYANNHLLLLRWRDLNGDRYIQMAEIFVEAVH